MSNPEPTSVLFLQAFHGGSHRQFITEWIENSRLNWTLLTLPGRHWKWRMRHAAIQFARQVDARWEAGDRWDMLICTDMLNLAEFKGLLKSDARRLPTLVYFHENQFEYPNLQNDPRDLHFAFTNLTTALAADQVWFNSNFNLNSMLDQLDLCLKSWPDYQPVDSMEQIRNKATIQYPGIVAGPLADSKRSKPVHVLWAARWEHDKNPKGLLEILLGLQSNDVDFRLSVIGEQFLNSPECFSEIHQRFSDRIVHWGFQDDRAKYWAVLQDADLYLSTAIHEFFGIATVEAIAAGCMPLLPNRLSYPELLSSTQVPDRKMFLYENIDEAVSAIQQFVCGKIDQSVVSELSFEFRDRFRWGRRAVEMDSAIERFLEKK